LLDLLDFLLVFFEYYSGPLEDELEFLLNGHATEDLKRCLLHVEDYDILQDLNEIIFDEDVLQDLLLDRRRLQEVLKDFLLILSALLVLLAVCNILLRCKSIDQVDEVDFIDVRCMISQLLPELHLEDFDEAIDILVALVFVILHFLNESIILLLDSLSCGLIRDLLVNLYHQLIRRNVQLLLALGLDVFLKLLAVSEHDVQSSLQGHRVVCDRHGIVVSEINELIWVLELHLLEELVIHEVRLVRCNVLQIVFRRSDGSDVPLLRPVEPGHVLRLPAPHILLLAHLLRRLDHHAESL